MNPILSQNPKPGASEGVDQNSKSRLEPSLNRASNESSQPGLEGNSKQGSKPGSKQDSKLGSKHGGDQTSIRFFAAVVLMLGTALVLQARSRGEIVPTHPPLSSLPSDIDGWTSSDETLDQQTLDILGPGDFLVRDYDNPSQGPWINLYIAYFPSQRSGDTIHSPNHCLPGAGFVPTSREIVRLTHPDGTSFPVNRYVVSKTGERELVLYWFQAHGREVASEYWAKYYLIYDSIRMNRSDGALVRLMTPMLEGESADDAEARMMKLGSHIVPLLDTYVPR